MQEYGFFTPPPTLTDFFRRWKPNAAQIFINFTPSEQIPSYSYTILPPWKPNSYIMAILVSGGDSSKIFPVQPIASHICMA